MATTRKRSDRNAVDEETLARRLGATAEVTDDEVEEFLAILRNMRDAARSFAARGDGGYKKGKGEEAERKGQSASRWRPAFEREDFAVAGFFQDAVRRKKQISMAAASGSSTRLSRSRETAVAEEEDSVAAESSEGRSRSRSREAAMAEDEEESVAENEIPWGFLGVNIEPALEE